MSGRAREPIWAAGGPGESCAGLNVVLLLFTALMNTRAIVLAAALLVLTPAIGQTPATAPGISAPATSARNAATPGGGEGAAANGPPLLSAAEDHQRMVELLHLTELRPGVKQDGSGPNPVNWDESKANPWPKLPDPLVLNNGRPVKTAKMWVNQRRPELVEIFDREIVGRVPADVPGVRWEVVSASHGSEGGIATVTETLAGHVDNSGYPALAVTIDAQLTVPASAAGPVPVVMEITFDHDPAMPPAAVRPPRPAPAAAGGAGPAVRPATPGPPAPPPGPGWKQQVLAKGWGYALLYPVSFQADSAGPALQRGIIGVCSHGQPRKLDDWGAIRAWAWGASRLMDYFETDKAVDGKHVAVEGHSRFGKTALVTMAYDQRFAAAYVNSSGAGGAELARRRFGEQLENIAGGEYYWMAGNYLKYAGTLTPADLPVDMHELIALCAPRPVFLGGGTPEGGDGWADVRGTWMAEVAAGPVYRLLGRKSLSDENGPTDAFPPVGKALVAGDLAFRQHPYGHTPLPDYATFLEWAGRYMGDGGAGGPNPTHAR